MIIYLIHCLKRLRRADISLGEIDFTEAVL